eukprot:13991265-Heterocapsa_arctica.AAC.1
MCTAPASRWGLGSGCDVTSKKCRDFAKAMRIPCWSGEWFWDSLAKFTAPDNRQHHGERTGEDFSGYGNCLSFSEHWDRVIFIIISYLTANVFDCQTRLGWIKLYAGLEREGRKVEVLMDHFASVGAHTSSDDLAVKEVAEPILP